LSKQKNIVLRVAITGPESTGKSTLAAQLAEHYNTVCTSEYARQYLDQLSRPYECGDLLEILDGQMNEEETKQSEANRLLFCDTDPIVLKIWSAYKYGSVDAKIQLEVLNRSYDLYLLTDIDLPWEYDKQREQPNKREYFFDLFEHELKSKQANYHIVRGGNDLRLKSAIGIVDDFVGTKPGQI
jgi:NadR type nicotinamide-nucleotide adenylyltransferase